MNDVDGLSAAALFYGVTCVLLVIAALITRELVRRPAAMLAIVTGAIGSLLMVRHAPAGPTWDPPQWSTEHGVRSSVRFGLGMRDGGMPDGGRGPDAPLPAAPVQAVPVRAAAMPAAVTRPIPPVAARRARAAAAACWRSCTRRHGVRCGRAMWCATARSAPSSSSYRPGPR